MAMINQGEDIHVCGPECRVGARRSSILAEATVADAIDDGAEDDEWCDYNDCGDWEFAP